MHSKRFGEILARLVALSEHDVMEILGEQLNSGRRFGQIALGWGLCEPQHVWEAWWTQLGEEPDRVNLWLIGIDAQSLDHLPRAMAEAWGVIPVRAVDGHVVVAASPEGRARAEAALPALLHKEVRFVVADDAQIREAIRVYYPAAVLGHASVAVAIAA